MARFPFAKHRYACWALLFAVCALSTLWGCSSHEVKDATPLSVYLKEPPPEGATYRLQPGDELEIRFHQMPEENVTLPVRPDGFISLPMAPELRASGRTPSELRKALESAYSSELIDPRIAVIVKSFATYKVHVGGHVAKPGVFELEGGRTALQTIFEAGGFLDSASLEDVVVMRRAGPGKVDVIQVDLAKALDGSNTRQDLMLAPFDVVFVPASPIANMNRWVDLYLRRNLPLSLNVGWRF